MIAEIKKLGGDVIVDEKSADKPVVLVGLTNTAVTDAGLVNLKGLTHLQMLALGNTQVTDAGLEHLEGLTTLTILKLWGTSVTDAGLLHLRSLTQL